MPVVVVPDIPLAPEVAADLVARVGPVLFRHPSGRVWIVGTTEGRRVVRARTRHVEVVLLGDGSHGTDEAALCAAIANARTVDDVPAELFTEADVLLFARGDDRMRSQAPLFLTRSLCWTTVHDVPLISDEQGTLQRIADLDTDVDVLASRLTDSEISVPFGLRSVWSGLHALRPGQWLDSRARCAPRAVTWWHPPRPERGLDDLSEELPDALEAALRTRVAAHREVSADLSGGLDSTTLNFVLADLLDRPHHTLFLASSNVANGDRPWAARAAMELGTRHVVVPYRSVLPRITNDTAGTLATAPEGPSIASVSAAAVPLVEDVLRETGSTLHLNGHAGDALFGPVSTVPWSLAHSREKGRWRQLWRQRLVNRYPLGAMVRMLAERGTYRDDLERVARHDFRQPEPELATYARWAALPRVHPALTDAAREHVRSLARRELAEGHDAYGPSRTVHQIMQFLTVHGSDVRRMNHARTPGVGMTFDSPLLDRRVVEAALALRIGDRARQYPVKPLLAAARPARMSIDYFTRSDKGDYTAEVFEQHRATAPMVRELFADGSVLEDLGLISGERVLRSITEFSVDGSELRDLDQIVFAERWLRSLPTGEPDRPVPSRQREGEPEPCA